MVSKFILREMMVFLSPMECVFWCLSDQKCNRQFLIRNLAQGLVPNIPYFWTSNGFHSKFSAINGTDTDIEVLNSACRLGYNLRPMKLETLDTSVAKNLCWFWLQINGTGFLVLDCLLVVIIVIQTEKFLREFSISSLSSLDILALCRLLIKWFLIKTACKSPLDLRNISDTPPLIKIPHLLGT